MLKISTIYQSHPDAFFNMNSMNCHKGHKSIFKTFSKLRHQVQSQCAVEPSLLSKLPITVIK
ncbi:CLUMA_CG010272, isoform A [Clunio marinus]|uniref:CLUMA_CG010272, isoform A n=1 Tax=Clunio marinus TaxID=568069 RepID=A0A1J1IB24_9DIPT|nr:CLUMA_CG010272, isoform A [Clunio marinus]